LSAAKPPHRGRTRGILVSIAGPVGVGKTTVIRNVTRELVREGFPAVSSASPYVHSRFLFPMTLARMTGYTGPANGVINYLAERTPRLLRVVGPVWLLTDAIVSTGRFYVRIVRPVRRGSIVLCEDFPISPLADYRFFLTDLAFVNRGLLHTLEGIVLRVARKQPPDLIVYLDAGPDQLASRQEGRGGILELEEFQRTLREILASAGSRGLPTPVRIDTSGIDQVEAATAVLAIVRKASSGAWQSSLDSGRAA